VIETKIYCDFCNNKQPIETHICESCFNDLRNEVDFLNKKVSTLKEEIKYDEELIEKYASFKERVIKSPDCPKSIIAEAVAEGL